MEDRIDLAPHVIVRDVTRQAEVVEQLAVHLRQLSHHCLSVPVSVGPSDQRSPATDRDFRQDLESADAARSPELTDSLSHLLTHLGRRRSRTECEWLLIRVERT